MSSAARVPQLTDTFDVEEVLAKMKMQEKIKLLSGKDMSYTEAIPEHGIPSMRITDGMCEDITTLPVSDLATHRTKWHSRHPMYVSSF